MFCLIFTVKPAPFNEHYARVSGGGATLFVVAASENEARLKSEAYLSDAKWEILDLDTLVDIGDEIPSDDELLLKLYNRAKIEGIACRYDIGIRGADLWN
jgi:hypothetical protein